jgi:hypothetical protein
MASPRFLRRPVAPRQKRRAPVRPPTVLGRITALLGYVGGGSAFVYALGYVLNLSHLQMLGVAGQVDLDNDQVVYGGLIFFPRTAICWLGALFSWRGMVLVVLFGGVVFAWRRWRRLPASGATGNPRTRALFGVGACALWVLVAFLSLSANKEILNQEGLLPAGLRSSVKASGLWVGLTGCSANLVELLREWAAPWYVYGVLSILAALSAFIWFCLLSCWRGARTTSQASRAGWLPIVFFSVSGFFLLLQLLSTVLLYGYLVVGNSYPAVRQPPCMEETANAVRAKAVPPESQGQALLLLGRRGSRLVLFCTCSKRVLWVDESALLPVIQTGQRNVFDCPKE